MPYSCVKDFWDEPIGLGEEAIVGLPIEENELSWSLGRGWNEEWSLEDSLRELLMIPLELTDSIFALGTVVVCIPRITVVFHVPCQ